MIIPKDKEETRDYQHRYAWETSTDLRMKSSGEGKIPQKIPKIVKALEGKIVD